VPPARRQRQEERAPAAGGKSIRAKSSRRSCPQFANSGAKGRQRTSQRIVDGRLKQDQEIHGCAGFEALEVRESRLGLGASRLWVPKSRLGVGDSAWQPALPWKARSLRHFDFLRQVARLSASRLTPGHVAKEDLRQTPKRIANASKKGRGDRDLARGGGGSRASGAGPCTPRPGTALDRQRM